MAGRIHTAHSGVNTGKLNPSLVEALRITQERFGKPLTLTSGYRSPSHNKKVGGAGKSQHMHGNAFDFSTRGWAEEDRQRLAQIWRTTLKEMGLEGRGGVGVYKTSMHLDVGPSRGWGSNYSKTSLPDSWKWLSGGGGPVSDLPGGHHVGDDPNHTGDAGLDVDKTKDGKQEIDPEQEAEDKKMAILGDAIKQLTAAGGSAVGGGGGSAGLRPTAPPPQIQSAPPAFMQVPVDLARYYNDQGGGNARPQAGLPAFRVRIG